ncbi:hypothetical protein [Vibrio vulnificus]|uniref:hypothetical protein n=1 Tax=Vibrio vulnificus TaxID=672 RepID=UPI003F67D7E2
MDSESRSYLAIQNDERKELCLGKGFKQQVAVKRPINTLSPPPVIPASLSATRDPFIDER